MSVAFAAYGSCYTDDEDRQIIAMVKADVTRTEIAKRLNRSPGSISGRVGKLRTMGLLPSDVPVRRAAVCASGYLAVPPLRLDRDDELVIACLAHGGFPRAEVIQGLTYWFGPNDMLWTGRLAA